MPTGCKERYKMTPYHGKIMQTRRVVLEQTRISFVDGGSLP